MLAVTLLSRTATGLIYNRNFSQMDKICAYIRTSSVSDSKKDNDSKPRQLEAIKNYAKSNNLLVAKVFYDAGVSGADDVLIRPEFQSMLLYCEQKKIGTIVVENASRLARDSLVALLAHKFLKDKKIKLVAADNPELFVSNTPTNELLRTILIAISAFEKQTIVHRLAHGKAKKLQETGKCGGRRSYREMNSRLVKLAKRERENGLSLREISKLLAEKGYFNSKKQPIHPVQISRMVA